MSSISTSFEHPSSILEWNISIRIANSSLIQTNFRSERIIDFRSTMERKRSRNRLRVIIVQDIRLRLWLRKFCFALPDRRSETRGKTMCEVSPTCVPTETAALFRIKEPPKSVLRYDVESRIITLKRKTKLTRIPTIRLPVTRLSSNFFITHHHPLSLFIVSSFPFRFPYHSTSALVHLDRSSSIFR